MKHSMNTSLPAALLIGIFCSIQWVHAGYEVTDSFGKHQIQAPPTRVVVTDWALLEQMLELDVNPVGAPELDLYRRYVKRPILPSDNIVDIGLRLAPKLQSLRKLKPDLIIVGTGQKNLARPFSRVAPVMYYNSFSDKYRTNGKKSRVRFLQLADLFQKRALAETKLASMDQEISEIREALLQHFNHKPPKVTIVRFSSHEKVLIYGENSMPLHALEQLGLQSGVSISRSKWGYKEMPISILGTINDGVILYIKPTDALDTLLKSDTWLSLLAVKEQRIHPMNAAWSYGGAMSILYNARAIQKALISIH